MSIFFLARPRFMQVYKNKQLPIKVSVIQTDFGRSDRVTKPILEPRIKIILMTNKFLFFNKIPQSILKCTADDIWKNSVHFDS